MTDSSFPSSCDLSASTGHGQAETAWDKLPVSRQAAGFQPGRVDSAELLRGQKAVEISHNGATYRLQATRLGKLILTK